jgi:hypothetical protein
MGGAAASSADQWRLSGEVGDPYPQSCRDQDGPVEVLRRWPVFFGLWNWRELGLAVLRGRAFANRVRRRLLVLAVELVRLERDAPVWQHQGRRARVPKLGGRNFDRCQLLL